MDSKALHARALRGDIEKTIESVGGSLEAMYFAFGHADFYLILDVPDNVSAAALSIVANGSGFVTSKIVVLMTTDEMDQAIRKTATIAYMETAMSSAPTTMRYLGCTLAARRPTTNIITRVTRPPGESTRPAQVAV
jgi:uncharacterized protein with GYD domain